MTTSCVMLSSLTKLLHTHTHTHTGSEACSHFSVYFKHMARRFKELKIDSLLIARMDLTDESPPPHLNLVVGKLPLVIMLPAGSKSPPWTYFSGKYYSVLQGRARCALPMM